MHCTRLDLGAKKTLRSTHWSLFFWDPPPSSWDRSPAEVMKLRRYQWSFWRNEGRTGRNNGTDGATRRRLFDSRRRRLCSTSDPRCPKYKKAVCQTGSGERWRLRLRGRARTDGHAGMAALRGRAGARAKVAEKWVREGYDPRCRFPRRSLERWRPLLFEQSVCQK